MANYGLNIIIWNANKLFRKSLEVKHLLQERNIDIFFISETHFTSRSFFRIHPIIEIVVVLLSLSNRPWTITTITEPHLQAIPINSDKCSGFSSDHIPLLIYFAVAAYQDITKSKLLPRSSLL